jgi:hypothetical protein
VPGIRTSPPAVTPTREADPLLGFLLLGVHSLSSAPPRLGSHPSLRFRTIFGLAPRNRPGAPRCSTADRLARLQEPSDPSEVPSPIVKEPFPRPMPLRQSINPPKRPPTDRPTDALEHRLVRERVPPGTPSDGVALLHFCGYPFQISAASNANSFMPDPQVFQS